MAIFGGLSEISLPDVMSLIGKSIGSLVIEQKHSDRTDRFELYLDSRLITRMSINEIAILNMAQARSFITELIRSNTGDFRFFRGANGSGNFSIPVNEILLSSLSMVEEMEAARRHFPDPHTIFTAARNENGFFDAETRAFWQLAEPYFVKGASAQDLFEHLGFYLDQILFRCHKLRLAGFIIPQRAYVKQAEEEAVPEPVEIKAATFTPLIEPEPSVALPKRSVSRIQTGDLILNIEPIRTESKSFAISLHEPGKATRNGHATAAVAPVRATVNKPVSTVPDRSHKLEHVHTRRPDKGLVNQFMTSLKGLMGGRR